MEHADALPNGALPDDVLRTTKSRFATADRETTAPAALAATGQGAFEETRTAPPSRHRREWSK